MSQTIIPAETSVLVDHLKQWNVGAERNELVMPKASFNEAPQRSYNLQGRKDVPATRGSDFRHQPGLDGRREALDRRQGVRWFFTQKTATPIPFATGTRSHSATGPAVLHPLRPQDDRDQLGLVKSACL
jgi:hypothetical protein